MAVSADTANALITIDDDLREYLGITAGDTAQDSRLQMFINAFSGWVNAYTRRKIKARDLTEYYDGTALDTLFVDNYPINSLTNLYVDTGRDYDAASEITSGDYMIYSAVGKIVLDDDIFDAGAQSVKIVYNGGYATIPWELQQVTREFLLAIWDRDRKGLVNVSSISTEGQSVSYENEGWMPKSILDVLTQYRRLGHG